jgi:nicotinamidase/pyrazinamidase
MSEINTRKTVRNAHTGNVGSTEADMSKLCTGLLCVVVLLLTSCSANDEVPQEAGRRALIIVDMQNDFSPGGARPAEGGDQIVELINRLQQEFDLVVATQDWHPENHGSFASNHPGREPGEVIELKGLKQELWPDHAVQGSTGAEFVSGLDRSRIAKVFQKGTDPEVDSYSGFFDNGQQGDTGLDAFLEGQGVNEVFVVGLALDYCVKFTALDAERIGYDTTVIVDASRPVGDGAAAVEVMQAAGVKIASAINVLGSATR